MVFLEQEVAWKGLTVSLRIWRVASESVLLLLNLALNAVSESDFVVMVLDAYQRQGVGRWLVGHAIGVAESKGGRELLVPLPGPVDFFQGLGFRQIPSGFRYVMSPE